MRSIIVCRELIGFFQGMMPSSWLSMTCCCSEHLSKHAIQGTFKLLFQEWYPWVCCVSQTCCCVQVSMHGVQGALASVSEIPASFSFLVWSFCTCWNHPLGLPLRLLWFRTLNPSFRHFHHLILFPSMLFYSSSFVWILSTPCSEAFGHVSRRLRQHSHVFTLHGTVRSSVCFTWNSMVIIMRYAVA